MNTKNNLFSDFLSSILFLSEGVGTFDLPGQFDDKVTVKVNDGVYTIEINDADIDDNEYEECVGLFKRLTLIIQSLRSTDSDFDIDIKIGDRPHRFYHYNHETEEFTEITCDEDKQNVGADLRDEQENDKNEELDETYLGGDMCVEDANNKIELVNFAESLRESIIRKHTEHRFDVEEAISKLCMIDATDDYELIYNETDEDSIDGIIVFIDDLNDGINPCCECIDAIINSQIGGDDISKFTQKCVALGFSHVDYEIYEDEDEDDYKTILFYIYF